jgi:ornithine carbamoyltransferase
MGSVAPPRPPTPPAPLPAGDERALLEQARGLKRAAAAGRLQPLLRGKNLGLLCRNLGTPGAQLFLDAAAALGAHVAHIECSRIERSSSPELAYTARMLGRLYDAVECQGLDAHLVRQLADAAGITVLDGLAADEALIARLAGQLDGVEATLENRRFTLQALLLQVLT